MNKIILSIIFLILNPLYSNAQKIKPIKKIKSNNRMFENDIKQAQSLEKNGLSKEAEKIYRNILNQDPTYRRAFRKLRSLLKTQNLYDELIILADRHLNALPNDPMVKIDQIEIYLWAKDESWIKMVNETISLNLKNNQILKNLINRIISNGYTEDAFNFIEIVREKNKQPAFYASELGSYFQMRMSFENSLENYLLYLDYNPNKYNMVSSRLMSFPTDDFIVKKLKGILEQSIIMGSKLLLSDLEFRSGNFIKSYTLLKDNFSKPEQLLKFSQHAINAKAFDVALKAYTDIINGNFKNHIIRSAIYGMANTLELKSIKSEPLLPISSFFDGNEFFESPYYTIEESLLPSLLQSVEIYDSLRIKDGNLDATFRLAEIKFRAMNDLDGAFTLYERVAQKARERELRFSAALRIIDIMLAKGDLQKGLTQINLFKENFTPPNKQIILKIKESQINFYSGEFQSSSDTLIQILKNLPRNDPRYNDLLDVQSIILAFKENNEFFNVFTEIQLLIRQNKRTQALERLNMGINNIENDFIKDIFLYQSAYIYVLQNEFNLAIKNLKLTSENTIFSEVSMILHAEITDYFLNDISNAIDIYLQFLENYPLSIYYDDIRIRLREIAS